MSKKASAVVVLCGIMLLYSACVMELPGNRKIGPANAEKTASSAARSQESSKSAEEAPASLPAPVVKTTATGAPTSNEAMPIPTPADDLKDYYRVQEGDTLSSIAWKYGLEIDQLMAINGLSNQDFISAGQLLLIPSVTKFEAPIMKLAPDSEIVLSPAYIDFDLNGFISRSKGYLAAYSEVVIGRLMSGAEIVDLIAHDYSVGPRPLLALMEYESGWVRNPSLEGNQLTYPMGYMYEGRVELYYQLSKAADLLNEGYYTYKRQGSMAITFKDGQRAKVPYGLNAGTVAIYNVLAHTRTYEEWQLAISSEGFIKLYKELFGDPFGYAFEPLVPANLTQPKLFLPWGGGETFYYTGGPHGAWGNGSGLAAVDFGPPDVMGSCNISGKWVTAAASGVVVRSETGQVILDLDGDGKEETGWDLLYLHLAIADSIKPGLSLAQGDLMGHASCEGGTSDSSHLHFARKYNGEWMPAAGQVPLEISGWKAVSGDGPYNGQLKRDNTTLEACECWDNTLNALISDNMVVPN